MDFNVLKEAIRKFGVSNVLKKVKDYVGEGVNQANQQSQNYQTYKQQGINLPVSAYTSPSLITQNADKINQFKPMGIPIGQAVTTVLGETPEQVALKQNVSQGQSLTSQNLQTANQMMLNDATNFTGMTGNVLGTGGNYIARIASTKIPKNELEMAVNQLKDVNPEIGFQAINSIKALGNRILGNDAVQSILNKKRTDQNTKLYQIAEKVMKKLDKKTSTETIQPFFSQNYTQNIPNFIRDNKGQWAGSISNKYK